jgi:hypothetical protein
MPESPILLDFCFRQRIWQDKPELRKKELIWAATIAGEAMDNNDLFVAPNPLRNQSTFYLNLAISHPTPG